MRPLILPALSLIWLLCLLLINRAIAQEQRYWTLQEFYQSFPQQSALLADFEQRINAPAVPLEQPHELVTIFVIYPSQQVSDYWRRSIRALTTRLDELQVHYQLISHHTRAVVSSEQQQRLLAKAQSLAPDYLIFTLETEQHQQWVEQLLQNSSSKVILQNVTTPNKAWQQKPPFFYVGFDHQVGSELLLNYYQQRFAQAPYAVMNYAPGYIADQRTNHFMARQQQQGAPLLQHRYTDASRRDAYEQALTMLRDSPQPKFIYAAATDVALGVAQALEELELEQQIMVNGWGGGSQELEALMRGKLDVTVMRMNDDAGVAMAEAIALDVKGQRDQVPQVYSGRFELVQSDTSLAQIERLTQRAFRYSGVDSE